MGCSAWISSPAIFARSWSVCVRNPAWRPARPKEPDMAILIKTAAEIEKMRRSGEALRQVHEAVRPYVVAGASTMDLENVAAAKMDALHAISAFKGYHGFPAVLCTSVNSEVVHGIPSAKRILADGDIISIDCGVIVDGFYSDSAVTYAVGTPSPATRKLLEVTQASLEQAILQAQVGGRLGDISAAVQEMCEAQGFSVVREFVGHGIGRSMHEDPQVPNFGPRGKRSEEHTSELQSLRHLVCRLLLEKKKR